MITNIPPEKRIYTSPKSPSREIIESPDSNKDREPTTTTIVILNDNDNTEDDTVPSTIVDINQNNDNLSKDTLKNTDERFYQVYDRYGRVKKYEHRRRRSTTT